MALVSNIVQGSGSNRFALLVHGYGADERDLGRVPSPVEHRLAGEEAADRDPVEAPGEHRRVGTAGTPDLDAVRPSERVQPRVRGHELLVDPAVGSSRVGAAAND